MSNVFFKIITAYNIILLFYFNRLRQSKAKILDSKKKIRLLEQELYKLKKTNNSSEIKLKKLVKQFSRLNKILFKSNENIIKLKKDLNIANHIIFDSKKIIEKLRIKLKSYTFTPDINFGCVTISRMSISSSGPK